MFTNGSMYCRTMTGISYISLPSASTICVLYKSLHTSSIWLVFYADLNQKLVHWLLFQVSPPLASKMTVKCFMQFPTLSQYTDLLHILHFMHYNSKQWMHTILLQPQYYNTPAPTCNMPYPKHVQASVLQYYCDFNKPHLEQWLVFCGKSLP